MTKEYIQHYNYVRAHQRLDNVTPYSIYRSQQKVAAKKLNVGRSIILIIPIGLNNYLTLPETEHTVTVADTYIIVKPNHRFESNKLTISYLLFIR
jgi:hypothetical protein